MRTSKMFFLGLWLAFVVTLLQPVVLVETDPIPPVGLKGQPLPSCPAAQVDSNVYCR